MKTSGAARLKKKHSNHNDVDRYIEYYEQCDYLILEDEIMLHDGINSTTDDATKWNNTI